VNVQAAIDVIHGGNQPRAPRRAKRRQKTGDGRGRQQGGVDAFSRVM